MDTYWRSRGPPAGRQLQDHRPAEGYGDPRRENISPSEIEELLFTHPAISQAAVFGVPDAKYGEELCAWVQLHHGKYLTAEEVRAHCEANLAHYKVPRSIEFVSEFPTTVSGKIQKYKMREQMCRTLHLREQETA